MRICFFIGHREAGESLLPTLTEVVERHITEYGVTEFVVGGYGGFDRLAAGAVMAAKQRHPAVTLTRLLPYHPAEKPVALPTGFDGTLYPPDMERVPRRLAILRANRYMVEHAEYLIAYAGHPGNARQLLEYALQRSAKGLLRVENLFPSGAKKDCNSDGKWVY